MNVKEYVELLGEIWRELDDSTSELNQDTRAILAAQILEEISKDRRMNEISNEKRQRLSKPSGKVSIEQVKSALGEDAKLMEFSTGNGLVIVKPKSYIDNPYFFGQICRKIDDLGGRWVSQGDNSRWEI